MVEDIENDGDLALQETRGREELAAAYVFTVPNDREVHRGASLRRPDCYCGPSPVAHAGSRERLMTAVLHALEGTARPCITTVLGIAEQLRRKLMGIHKGIVGDSTGVSGKTERQGYGTVGRIALGYACHFGLGLFVPAPGVQG